MEVQSLFLGVKVKPGPIERIKLENYSLHNTVENLKMEAEKKINVPASSLDLIHHGKLLKESTTLQDSGVKNGEMVHVVKKKENPPPAPLESFSDSDLRELNSSLRMLGCTPNAPGWTRAMQLLNEESVLEGIIAQAPTLGEDCVALSILHEVELLAALGATVQTMRRGASTHPELPVALRQLTSLVQARTFPSNEHVPTSGFAYSLEALSEDEDAEEEETEETERGPITQEQLAAALQQAATEAVSASAGRSNSSQESLLRLFRGPAGESSRTTPSSGEDQRGGSATPVITAEVFSEAIAAAMSSASSARRRPATSPMEQSTDASSSQSPLPRDEDYSSQLNHMHEMGLLDDALNVRALLICAGDVNAAINLVFSGAIGDD